MSGDQDHIGMGLAHTRCDSANADFCDELYMHPGMLIGVLEVMDKLCEILDRVDVVMRWWRDETDARSRVPDLRYPGVDLVSR